MRTSSAAGGVREGTAVGIAAAVIAAVGTKLGPEQALNSINKTRAPIMTERFIGQSRLFFKNRQPARRDRLAEALGVKPGELRAEEHDLRRVVDPHQQNNDGAHGPE